jgi:predicted ATP-grasp superfamily ATP-dependent carboligase
MKKILITGAGGPAGINFVKSLQIAPEPMTTIGTESNEYFIHLAVANKKYLIPRAIRSEYIDSLNRVIEKEKVEFVHPQPDIEVEVVSENREKLKADVFLPSKQTVRTCQDKMESTKQWQKKGVPTAKFLELRGESDVDKAFDQFKNRIWIRATHGAGGRGSTPAEDRDTALSWIRYWKSRKVDWRFIAQENLPGRNIGFHSLWKEGELVTSMTRERIEYIYAYLAPSGITGTPSVQRTIHDKRANRVATEAVLSIDPNFSGIACVDLKENSEGTPCVTEINAGRMFTTSFFFSYASKTLRKDSYANIPYLYVKLAFKESIPKIPQYDILPENLYWIRHMDAPARLVKDGKVLGEMYR